MRFDSALEKWSCAFALAFLSACGDDDSLGINIPEDHGDTPYCEVRESESGFVREAYTPDYAWEEYSVTSKGDEVTIKLEAVFYGNYSRGTREMCERLASTYAEAAGSTFKCGSSGAKFVVTTIPLTDDFMETELSYRKKECENLLDDWGLLSSSSREGNSSAKSSSSSSSSSNKSSSSSSSSNKMSSSSDPLVPATKILGGDKYNAFTDKRDGKAYRVIQVRDFVWMLDNLQYAGSTGDNTLGGNVYCKDCGVPGYLYDYAAAMDNPTCKNKKCNTADSLVQGACPDGWALPTAHAWWLLAGYIEDADSFFANPLGEWGGSWKNDGIARFWTSTEDTDSGAMEYYYSHNEVHSQAYSKSMGYAIRCIAVKDVVLDTLVVAPSSSATSSSSSAPIDVPVSSSSVLSSSSSAPIDVPVSSSSVLSSSSKDESYYVRSDEWAALDTFVDARDGQSYRMVEIEGLVWMAENLRYRDSSETPLLKGKTWCIGSYEEYCEYGVLYTFDAAMNDAECASGKTCGNKGDEYRGICPEGWHLPVDAEWNASFMISPATNPMSLFAPVRTGEHGRYGNAFDSYARFWTAVESTSTSASEWYIDEGAALFAHQEYNKTYGYAVRCVKNTKIPENN